MAPNKCVLIVEEESFSRVCMAMLKSEGYRAIVPVSFDEARGHILDESVSLVIINYQSAAELMEMVGEIPVILLVEELNDRVLKAVNTLQRGICMLKPIDFNCFRRIIRRIMDEDPSESWTKILA